MTDNSDYLGSRMTRPRYEMCEQDVGTPGMHQLHYNR